MSSKHFHIEYYLPEGVYSNDDFFKEFPNEKKENYDKLGISERRIIGDETASDLAINAANKLFASRPDILTQSDYLIFCAQELDHYTPSTAVIMQDRLNLKPSIAAFDFNHGCSGYPYGLFMAKSFLDSNGGEGALFLTGYTLSNVIHAQDKSSRFLFGDAGTATFISKAAAERFGKAVFKTIGASKDTIIVRDGFARNAVSDTSYVDKADSFGNVSNDASFFMNGLRVFSFAIKEVPEVVEECLEVNNLQKDDIDFYVFHQANAFMLSNIARKLGIAPEKFIIDLEHTGNTGQSSIPIALKHLDDAGQLQSGVRLMLVGFGTGLSISAITVQL